VGSLDGRLFVLWPSQVTSATMYTGGLLDSAVSAMETQTIAHGSHRVF